MFFCTLFSIEINTANKNASNTRNLQIRDLGVEYIFIILLLSGLFYFLFGITMQAQFALVDDHQILNVAALEKIDLSALWDSFASNVSVGGRFKIGHVLIPFIGVSFFGVNPQLWHGAVIVAGIFTCFFLYAAMRQMGADMIASFLFVLLLATTGSQNSIWYRLLTGETWGMLFVAISVWAMTHAAHRPRPSAWDALALVGLLIAVTFKESFILVVPALLLLRWVLQVWVTRQTWLQALHTLRLPLTIGALIFVINLSLVIAVLFYKPDGYGAGVAGLSLHSFDPRVWYNLLTQSDLNVLAYQSLAFIVLFFVMAYSKRKEFHIYLLAGFGIVVLWLVPQLILHSHTLGGHYLFPAIVGLAAISGLALAILWKKHQRLLWVVCVIWLSVSIFNGFSPTIKRASSYTADSLALQAMIDYLAQNVADNQVVVIVADPIAHFEGIISLQSHLRFSGLNVPVYLLPILPENNPIKPDLTALVRTRPTDLNTLGVDDVGAIVGFQRPNAATEIPLWFVPSDWQEITFSKPIHTFSFKEWAYQEVDTYEYVILDTLNNR